MGFEQIFSDCFPEPATLIILAVSVFCMFGSLKKNKGPRVS